MIRQRGPNSDLESGPQQKRRKHKPNGKTTRNSTGVPLPHTADKLAAKPFQSESTPENNPLKLNTNPGISRKIPRSILTLNRLLNRPNRPKHIGSNTPNPDSQSQIRYHSDHISSDDEEKLPSRKYHKKKASNPENNENEQIEGGFGVVSFFWQGDPRQSRGYACKKPIIKKDKKPVNSLALAQNELRIFQMLYPKMKSEIVIPDPKKPNDYRLITPYLGSDGFTLWQECYNDDVDSNLDKAQLLNSMRLRLLFLLRACKAIDTMHEQAVIHCDLTLENMVYNKNYHVKIIDFASSVSNGARLADYQTQSITKQHAMKRYRITSLLRLMKIDAIVRAQLESKLMMPVMRLPCSTHILCYLSTTGSSKLIKMSSEIMLHRAIER